jgi:superfamily II DNA or RNA helicase
MINKKVSHMQNEADSQQQKKQAQGQILFVTALDLLRQSTEGSINQQENGATSSNILVKNPVQTAEWSLLNNSNIKECIDNSKPPAAILHLSFPFKLKPDQERAVEAWLANDCRGSIIYGTGTGKTEIALECAKRAAGETRNPIRAGQPKTAICNERTNGNHNNNNVSNSNMQGSFNVLMLVPRIVLIDQNFKRLVSYGIPPEKIGRYFGEQKDVREITISTYHSAIGNKRNIDIIKRANMIVFDEVHLAGGTARAFSRIFDQVAKDRDKALLGLTATINEKDPANSTIMALLPPVRKYLIKDAVADGRLARPIIFPLKVVLTAREQRAHEEYSKKIRTISTRLKRYNANGMMELLNSGEGGFLRWQARAWFLNVRKRKNLLASADNKLATAVELIKENHNHEKVMVFSETLESVRKLKQLLEVEGIDSALIDSKIPSLKRQRILAQWGSKFYVLLSVHTLEIGYDVPDAAVEIILSSSSNMNQIVQRIGRVLRKVKGKKSASVYVIYVSETRDSSVLEVVNKAIESSGGKQEHNRGEKRKLLQQQHKLKSITSITGVRCNDSNRNSNTSAVSAVAAS